MKRICCLLLSFVSVAMADKDQKILPLSTADQRSLEDQRSAVSKYLSPSDVTGKFTTAAGKLGTLRALLSAHIVKATQTYELQSMGVVFGDAFVNDMGFHWVIVEDSYGRDPATRYKETSVLLFPLTMISKRIEKGQDVDVFGLYNQTAEDVSRLVANGS